MKDVTRCTRPYKGVADVEISDAQAMKMRKWIYHLCGFYEHVEVVRSMLHQYGRSAVLEAIDAVAEVEAPIGKGETCDPPP